MSTSITGIIKNIQATDEIHELNTKDQVYVYTDGSNTGDGKLYSGAYAIVVNNTIIASKAVYGNDPEQAKQRNVTGELLAVLIALQEVESRDIKDIIICHDYNGVSKLINNEFTARGPLAIGYKKYVEDMKCKGFNIRFSKIKGHTGVEYNEYVDNLAKEIIKVGKYKEKS